MRNEIVDIIQRELDGYGIKSWVEQGGKHLKVLWNAKGQDRFYITSSTPSDNIRSKWNARADVRRMIRADGLQRVTYKPSLKVAMTPGQAPKGFGEQIAELRAEVDALIELLLDQVPPTLDLGITVNGVRITLAKAPEPEVAAPRVAVQDGPSERILAALDFANTKSPAQLSEELGMKGSNVASLLQYMKRTTGKVENLTRGQWRKKRVNGH